MSGEMIAIVAVGVALAGVILTSLRGTEARLGAQSRSRSNYRKTNEFFSTCGLNP